MTRPNSRPPGMARRPSSNPPRAASTPPPLGEPEDPIFVRECRELYERWQSGALTMEAVMGEFRTRLEAAANHVGNRARAEMMLGLVLTKHNKFDAAMAHYDRAHDDYMRAGQVTQANGCKLNIARLQITRGNYAFADQSLASLYDSSVRHSDIYLRVLVLSNRGNLFQRMEQYERALVVLEEALGLTNEIQADRQSQVPSIQSDIYATRSRVALDIREMDKALEWAQQAITFAEQSGWAAAKATAYRIMGRVVAALELESDAPPAPEDPAEAKPNADYYFDQATQLFREMEMDGEVAQTYYDHAVTLVEQGANEKARVLLRKAMVGFNRVGMADDAARAAELHTRLVG